MNPKKLSSRFLVCLLAITVIVAACTSSYGKKVTIEGTKGEVYYKGDGVTEADAKKLGDYLKEEKYFDNATEKSVQITKEGGRYIVRIVVDPKVYKETKEMDDIYTLTGAQMAEKLFNKTATDVVVTDQKMKDIKTYPYKPEVLEATTPKETDNTTAKQKTFANNTLYYSDNVSDSDADMIIDYFKKNEFFTETGNNDIILKKGSNDEATFTFSIKSEYANEEWMSKIDEFVKKMKADLFTDHSLTFVVADEQMKELKTFNY